MADGIEALKQAIMAGHENQAIRERERDVIDAARGLLNTLLNGEPLPKVIGAQSGLERALNKLDYITRAIERGGDERR
jgi:hypothetical protein